MKKLIPILLLISSLYADQISFKNNTFKAISNWQLNKSSTIVTMIKNNGAYYNLYFTKDIKLKDGKISVDFRANSGSWDQGGGIMWRVQDKDNYYIARFNPLEDNFTYYKVINGRRITLKSSHIRLSNNWHTMTILQNNNHFEGYLDNKKLLLYNDDSIIKSGGIGLWTKSDAKTSFKNFNIDK